MQTYTPKELAEACNTSPKNIRKYLRSLSDERAGRGGAWAIECDIDEFVEAYENARGRSVTRLTFNTPDA